MKATSRSLRLFAATGALAAAALFPVSAGAATSSHQTHHTKHQMKHRMHHMKHHAKK
jgi:hypothetical protein